MDKTKQQSETMVPGIGIYQHNSSHGEDDYEVIEPSSICESSLQRVNLPQQQKMPSLDTQTFNSIIQSLFWLIYVGLGIAYKYVVWTFRDKLTAMWRWIVPPTLEDIQNAYVVAAQRDNLKRKWSSISELPSYVCQLEMLPLLQEIGHQSEREMQSKCRPPEACPAKTLVRLRLDNYGRPFMLANVEEIPTSFLIDTGASLSILSRQSFDALPNRDSLPRIRDIPKVFDHQMKQLDIPFGVVCNVTIDGKTLILPFLVSNLSSSNVIGTDALIGRCIHLTHSGTDAYLVLAEAPAGERPKVQLNGKIALYVSKDVVIPGESHRRIPVTPFIYPAQTAIRTDYMLLNYVDTLEGLEGLTTSARLDKDGYMNLRVRNRSILDFEIPKCSILAFGEYNEPYHMPKRKKGKDKERTSSSPRSPSSTPPTTEEGQEEKQDDKYSDESSADLGTENVQLESVTTAPTQSVLNNSNKVPMDPPRIFSCF